MAALVSMLGIASAAQSAVIIDFTSGGSSSIVASASSSITVDVFLTATGATRVNGYTFSVSYDSDVDGANSLVNFPTHAASASWTSGGPGLSFDGGDGVIGSVMSVSTIFTPAADITAADGTVFIGSIKFHVTNAVSTDGIDIDGCFNCDVYPIDFISGAGDLTTTFNGLAVNVVPEPTTASLLGLGLLGLTVAGRRRS
jgi:hypothetical protein